ncbi:hypothetical protein DLH72_02490 [Candidatus Gracilibacteria bacterium]|nr:MAG: hypothetical protein DLH72_02490 [Candidatus Gracilibacteria bacterium]
MSKEIYKGKETELKTRFEKSGYDWESVKSQLEKIELSEEIDSKLSELEGNTEDYYNYLKGLIDKQAAENQVDSENAVISSGEKLLLEQVEGLKKTPIIGGALHDLAQDLISDFKSNLEEKSTDSWWDKFVKKMKIGFGTFILGIFGVKISEDMFKKPSSPVELSNDTSVNLGKTGKETTNEDNSTKKGDNVDIKDKEKEGSEVLAEKINETKEVSAISKYGLGFNVLLGLSGEKYEKGISKSEYMDRLKDEKYLNLLENKGNNLGNFDNNVLDENFPGIINGLLSQNTQDLLRIGLKGEVVKKILTGDKFDKENEKIKNELGEERFQEILKMIESKEYDYKKLTIKELSIFYVYTMPVFLHGSLVSTISSFKEYLPDSIQPIIGDQESEDMFFSKELIKKITPWGKEKISENKSKLLSELNLSDENDIKDFEKLYFFKDYILGSFLDEKALNLGIKEKNIIKEEINYRWIAVLYSIMGGKRLSDVNPSNLPIIILTIYEIIKNNNNSESYNIAGKYINRYMENFVSDTEVLSLDQKTVFKIYGKGFLKMQFNKTRNWISETLGQIGISTDDFMKYSIITGGTAAGIHVGTKYIVNKSIKKGTLSFLGLGARKFIKPLGMASIILGASSFAFSDEDIKLEFQDNLEKAYQEGDIKRFMELTKELEDSVKTIDVKIDGKVEKLGLISVPGETPLIIKGNKVYTIGLIPGKFDEFVKDFSFEWMENDTKLNGKSLYPIHIEGNNIVFGETGKRLDLSKTLNNIETKKSIYDGIQSHMNNTLEKLNRKFRFDTTDGDYLKLNGEVGGFNLGLVELFEKES